MIFVKDPKVRYVDMAIYIDNHIYTDNYDEELVYQYLYFLIYMLSKKRRYFNSEKVYDDFSVWLATNLYVRLTDKRQFDENEKLEKIKSILNYIKNILFAKRVEYNLQLGYQATSGKLQVKNPELVEDQALLNYYKPAAQSSNNEIIKFFVLDLFETIPEMFRQELKKSPYKNNAYMFNNLYLSCLLTFIQSTTPSNQELRKLQALSRRNLNADLSKLILKTADEIVLWNVPPYLIDYVRLLYRRVKKAVVNDIKDSISKHSLTDRELEAVINANYDKTIKETK